MKPNSLKKVTKKEYRALAAEREFVSIVIHELKSPLNITKWNLELLQDSFKGKLTKNQEKLLDQISRGNKRLLFLVQDLLDLAKLQKGKFNLKKQVIQLEDIINEVIDSLKVAAKEKKLSIKKFEHKKKVQPTKADPNRIEQIITNLLTNAIKYTANKGLITIGLKQLTGGGLKEIGNKIATAKIVNYNNKNGYLVVSVKDTGIGIAKEDQQKMFSRFFRSDKVLNTDIEGTGLGLFITKTIVELHKGDIWFTSQLGKGSTFYFSLPIV